MFAEGKNREFKREYTNDIKYAIVAFANTDGGEILIGIGDDGAITGVEDPDDVMLRVTNAARDTIRPDVTMFIDCEARNEGGKNVIAVSVQRGTARPYYIAGKGVRPEGVYVRQGASSVPASEATILRMIRETSGDCYEDARSLDQRLTFEAAAEYFKRRKCDFGAAQQKTLGLISPDTTYTNLGMLLSDQCVPTLKMAVFQGSRKAVFRDRKEISGSLLKQLEEAYLFLDRYNRTRSEFSGLERDDRRDYPPEALREALLNAIVHRDYAFSASILISVFDDRVEFLSVGGLLRGVAYDDIMMGVSALRNPRLANVFYRLHLIEAYGTGLMKIRECYAGFTPQPQIDVSSNAFKVTLPNVNWEREEPPVRTPRTAQLRPVRPAPPPQRKNQRQSIVVGFLKQRVTATRQELQSILGVSAATAVTTLRAMCEDGTLRREGSGKNTFYRLA